MHVPFVDLKAQYVSLKPQIDASIQHVIDRAAFVLGTDLKAFEGAFAAYLQVRHCIGVASGTDALRMALEALGVGRGDEVITVPNSFAATCEAISHAQATFRWVEVDRRTYNMDPSRIKAAITPRTRAILPVHLYGQAADMAPIMDVARRHRLQVLEDACQAHGARYREQRVGTFGDAACYSFYPSKNLGAYGDGGAVVTNDDAIAERLRLLRNHGMARKYEHLVEGCCSRLDSLQAALLAVKLPHLDDWNARRRAHARLYDELLADAPSVVTPYVRPDCEHVYHLYVVQVPERDRVRAMLRSAGVETGIHYPIPLHQQPAYARLGYSPEDFPVTSAIAPSLLSLPMYAELTDEQIRYVAATLRQALARV